MKASAGFSNPLRPAEACENNRKYTVHVSTTVIHRHRMSRAARLDMIDDWLGGGELKLYRRGVTVELVDQTLQSLRTWRTRLYDQR